MTAILKVDTIQDTSGNNIINESSDTITIGASGDTVNVIGTLQSNGTAVPTVAGGITQADMWRLTANTSDGTNADISANLERVDNASFGYIGSGMSQSSGVFTFPSTGIYEVSCVAMIICSSDINAMIEINVTTNNSSYDPVVNLNAGNESGDRTNISVGGSTLVDVTNTSNVKVKFTTTSFGSGTRLSGDSTSNYTYFKFIRLGDT
jgi:hypothetical protein